MVLKKHIHNKKLGWLNSKESVFDTCVFMDLWYNGFMVKSINISEELHKRLKIHCAKQGETVAGKVEKILTEVLDREDELAKGLLVRDETPVKKTIKESNEEIKEIEKNYGTEALVNLRHQESLEKKLKDVNLSESVSTLDKGRGELNGDDYI